MGRTPVAEFYAIELKKHPRVELLQDGDEVLPNMIAMDAPGHTPGHLMFVLSKGSRDVLFTGDAAKNRAELLSMTADASMNEAQSKASFKKMWDLWRRRPDNLLVPGHDIPMILKDGKPVYVGEREAAIVAWRGDDLEQLTTYDLTLV